MVVGNSLLHYSPVHLPCLSFAQSIIRIPLINSGMKRRPLSICDSKCEGVYSEYRIAAAPCMRMD